MEDAIQGTIQLMDAPAEKIKNRSSYNLSGLSFTPKELADSIKNHIPGFTISYEEGDPRQAIADSWPSSIDDTAAREDWGWKPKYGMDEMVKEMIDNLKNSI
jgi:nucleoside-diphosphate-sugar epimerase